MAKKSKKTETEAVKTVKEPMVYVGSSLKNGTLKQYTVFADGEYPDHVKELMAKSKAITGLMIPVSRLAQAKIDIRKTGSILNHFDKIVRTGKE